MEWGQGVGKRSRGSLHGGRRGGDYFHGKSGEKEEREGYAADGERKVIESPCFQTVRWGTIVERSGWSVKYIAKLEK